VLSAAIATRRGCLDGRTAVRRIVAGGFGGFWTHRRTRFLVPIFANIGTLGCGEVLQNEWCFSVVCSNIQAFLEFTYWARQVAQVGSGFRVFELE
jgi:hypothetical protein